uniref:Uncharacterized protein n=1 Tax=Arundo donax TaxID=35708 RepID=A0A0A9EFC5_ARUDO
MRPRSYITPRVVEFPTVGTIFMTHTGSFTNAAAKPPNLAFISSKLRYRPFCPNWLITDL